MDDIKKAIVSAIREDGEPIQNQGCNVTVPGSNNNILIATDGSKIFAKTNTSETQSKKKHIYQIPCPQCGDDVGRYSVTCECGYQVRRHYDIIKPNKLKRYSSIAAISYFMFLLFSWITITNNKNIIATPFVLAFAFLSIAIMSSIGINDTKKKWDKPE